MTKAVALKGLNALLFVTVATQFVLLVAARTAAWFYPVHVWLGWAIGAVILAHLWLNWGWIRNSYLGRRKPAKPVQ